MATQWYYAFEGERHGPVSEDAIRALLDSETITHQALIWKPGSGDWRPIGEVFTVNVSSTPPPVPKEEIGEPSVEPPAESAPTIAPLAGPWRRYFARMFDTTFLSLFGVLPLSALLGYLSPAYANMAITTPEPIFGLIATPVVLLLEWIIYSLFKTTPGKALLGVRVVNIHQQAASSGEYARRLTGLYWAGVGLGFPLFGLIAVIYQYSRVSTGEPASYDRQQAQVRASALSSGRSVGFTALFLGLLLGYVAIIAGLESITPPPPRDSLGTSEGSRTIQEQIGTQPTGKTQSPTLQDELDSLLPELNAGLPRALDEYTVLTAVETIPRGLVYQHELPLHTSADLKGVDLNAEIKPNVVAMYCNDESFAPFRDNNVTLRYEYYSNDEVLTNVFSVAAQDCP